MLSQKFVLGFFNGRLAFLAIWCMETAQHKVIQVLGREGL